MKIELHISFDSMEDYQEFSSRLEEKHIDLKIQDRSPLVEEIHAIPKINKPLKPVKLLICQNPHCQIEFDSSKMNYNGYCSAKCYNHVYWLHHKKIGKNTVKLTDKEFKEKMEKMKKENPIQRDRPEQVRTFVI
jgi:hypothetical protein